VSEWETFRKVVVDDVRRNHPVVANFTPCFLNDDHTTVGVQSLHFVAVFDQLRTMNS